MSARITTHFEGCGVRDADGKVSEDSECLVGKEGAKGEVVGDFVDGEEEVLVGGAAEDVGGGEELPMQRMRVPQKPRGAQLRADDEENDPLGQWLVAHELRDLHTLVRDPHDGSRSDGAPLDGP